MHFDHKLSIQLCNRMSVTKISLTNIFTSPETEFTSALVSHLYGVFPTHGFPNDTFFPSTYSIGEVVLENSGCAVNNKVGFRRLGTTSTGWIVTFICMELFLGQPRHILK